MREKLLSLMKEERLTASRLAELLGIQPSGISHIMNGRNNPSLDFIQKILRRFPRINPDWLILGEGEMYRTTTSSQSEDPSATSASTANGATEANTQEAVASSPSDGQQEQLAENPKVKIETSSAQAGAAAQSQIHIPIAHPTRGQVKRVIVLFDDHTFESYEAK